jgi:hypothetical protein
MIETPGPGYRRIGRDEPGRSDRDALLRDRRDECTAGNPVAVSVERPAQKVEESVSVDSKLQRLGQVQRSICMKEDLSCVLV